MHTFARTVHPVRRFESAGHGRAGHGKRDGDGIYFGSPVSGSDLALGPVFKKMSERGPYVNCITKPREFLTNIKSQKITQIRSHWI